jgi:hypothetical protein
MDSADVIDVYDSQTPQYHRAFQVFLDHTDQKDTARAWLDSQVQAVPSRQVLIDAGAGTGKVTAWYTDQFQQTIAIEPNPSLCHELRHTCPTAQVLPQMILAAQPAEKGDLVLCSHVFYYIRRVDWMRTLEQLVSWIAPQGALVAVLQNHETDCMRMLDHFFGQRFNLSELATAFHTLYGNHYQIDIETVPARVETSDLESAYIVAEFMLNLLSTSRPPARHTVIEYIQQRFATSTGTFRFSCDQDFLRIQPGSA